MKTLFPLKHLNKSGWLIGIVLFTYLAACSQSNHEVTATLTGTDKCQSPYFVVLGKEGETEQLPLKSTDVDVNIAGAIADIKVRQCYTNTGSKPIEAIYIFPASTRAAVYNMVMKIGEREIIAIVEEKNEARTQYETAKNEGKTASLLEEQRPNVFQMNVANIMPGATVEVELSYTELLVSTDNVYEFVYPTVVGPRYVSNAEIENNTNETWTGNPYLEEGVKPTSTLKLNVSLNTGIPLKEIRCETHKNDISYQGKSSATLEMKEPDGGNRDFVLQYRLAGEAIESGILLYEDPNGEKYFLAMMQPPKRVEPEMVTPREYVFIVDVSGSMSGFPLEVSKDLMKTILNGLKATDKFNIVLFAGGSEVYSQTSLPATQKNITAAVNYINNLNGNGGTELLDALKTAMNLNADDTYSRSFVILTDGYVSVEKEAFDYIRNNLGNANFFSFGIGSSVNRFIIEGMAHAGCGEPFVALDNQEAVKQAKKFISYVSSPVLTSINVSFNGFEAYDILPEHFPDLFANRPLIMVGKYKSEANGTITITGKTGNETFRNTWNVSNAIKPTSTKAIKYLWAREKIRIIGDYHNLTQNEELRKEIIKIGKQYNLLTEYTSFLAIDSEVSNKGGNQTTVKQPLPLPEGVSNNAVGNYSASYAPASRSYVKSKKAEAVMAEPLIMEESDDETFSLPAEKDEDIIYTTTDVMPLFQGGDIENFKKYIAQHLVYPREARDKSIKGQVFVRFVVDISGNVTDVEVIRSIDPLLDAEAVRLITNSPRWTPGSHNGKPVKVSYIIPVRFVM
jgi:Ca-activated chloride channel family protein